MRIATLVLAAGASSRMGGAGPKALLDAGDGRTFLARIADTAREAGAPDLYVVLAAPHGDAVAAAAPAGARLAWNPDPARGMLSSVQLGLDALDEHVDAALIWPVDHPLVRPATVAALLAALQHHDAALQHAHAAPQHIAQPRHDGRGGHPLLVPRARFADALALPLDGGLRALLAARPDLVVRVPTDDPATVEDIDTPDDLARHART